jgi:hypothetical protein
MPAQILNIPLHNRQSDPGALRLGRLERFEHSGANVFGNPGAIVGYRESNTLIRLGGGFDTNYSAVAASLCRVQSEIQTTCWPQ